jgi:hypothetical protein
MQLEQKTSFDMVQWLGGVFVPAAEPQGRNAVFCANCIVIIYLAVSFNRFQPFADSNHFLSLVSIFGSKPLGFSRTF